jgi:hypothetical protein
MEEKKHTVGATGNDSRPDDVTQEKTSIGGAYNSGVTSDDPAEKRKIEKKATLLENQPASPQEKKNPGTGDYKKE